MSGKENDRPGGNNIPQLPLIGWRWEALSPKIQRAALRDEAVQKSTAKAADLEAPLPPDVEDRLYTLAAGVCLLTKAYQTLREDMSKIVKRANRVDESAVMATYVLLGGDVAAVAALLDLNEADVERMAQRGRWAEAAARQRWTRERAVNRALNFAQAHRLRQLLDAFITGLRAVEKHELLEMLLDSQLPGNVKRRITFRDLAELARTMETVHHLTYEALGDRRTTSPEGVEDAGAKAAAYAGLFSASLAAAEAAHQSPAGHLESPENAPDEAAEGETAAADEAEAVATAAASANGGAAADAASAETPGPPSEFWGEGHIRRSEPPPNEPLQ